MRELSAAEAAQRLRVSPRRVRALLESGRLEGRRVAGRWLVSSDQVERRQSAPPAAGRPLSPAAAWHVLAVLSKAEEFLSGLAPPVRSRARARAAELRRQQPPDIAARWRSMLASRARISEFYAHPGVVRALLDDRRIVRSGISAAHDYGANLMVAGGAEGYIRSRDLPGISADYALNPEPGSRANVRLHVVEDDDGSWLFSQPAAPVAVVAADLMERDGPREQAAGATLAAGE